MVRDSNELNELIEELFESKSYIRDIKIKEVLKEETNIWSSFNFEVPEKHTFIDWIKKVEEMKTF